MSVHSRRSSSAETSNLARVKRDDYLAGRREVCFATVTFGAEARMRTSIGVRIDFGGVRPSINAINDETASSADRRGCCTSAVIGGLTRSRSGDSTRLASRTPAGILTPAARKARWADKVIRSLIPRITSGSPSATRAAMAGWTSSSMGEGTSMMIGQFFGWPFHALTPSVVSCT